MEEKNVIQSAYMKIANVILAEYYPKLRDVEILRLKQVKKYWNLTKDFLRGKGYDVESLDHLDILIFVFYIKKSDLPKTSVTDGGWKAFKTEYPSANLGEVNGHTVIRGRLALIFIDKELLKDHKMHFKVSLASYLQLFAYFLGLEPYMLIKKYLGDKK